MDTKELQVTGALVSALAGLEPSTLRHCQRVQKLSLYIGDQLGLTVNERAALSLGALLHDVGKQYVPQTILMKQTTLSTGDWEEIQKHPTYGWEYATKSALDEPVKDIILHHHLWFNGQGGYPTSGNGVRPGPLTQITTVADVVDAMTQDRPYRRALSLDASLDFLEDKRGTQFCPMVVDAVVQNVGQIGALVGL